MYRINRVPGEEIHVEVSYSDSNMYMLELIDLQSFYFIVLFIVYTHTKNNL